MAKRCLLVSVLVSIGLILIHTPAGAATPPTNVAEIIRHEAVDSVLVTVDVQQYMIVKD